MLHQNRNKHHTGLHAGSQMDTYILVSIKKGLLKIVNHSGFLEQLNTIFLTKGQVRIDVEIPVRAKRDEQYLSDHTAWVLLL